MSLDLILFHHQWCQEDFFTNSLPICSYLEWQTMFE